jgi:hypothetical protein
MANEKLPVKVIEPLASLGGDFVFDGGPVAFDSQGRPSNR